MNMDVRIPAIGPATQAVPPTTRAGPASHAVSDAADQPASGQADAAGSGAPAGTDTTPSSDWLAELHFKPVREQAPPGVPISTKPRDPARQGRAVASTRGKK